MTSRKTLEEALIVARTSDPQWLGEELFRLQEQAARYDATRAHGVERSRRSVQRTIRLTILVITMLTGSVLACLRPVVAWPIVTMMTVLVLGALLAEYFNREDRSS